MSYLLRIVLPDRPGALGAVATALGSVEADILSVDIVQRVDGRAMDDIVVALPANRLADSLVSAAAQVEGVRVESIRPYAGATDPHRELELLDHLAAAKEHPHVVLADGVARIFRAGWALVLDEPGEDGVSQVLARSVAAPETSELKAPWWPADPARALEPDEGWAPSDLVGIDTEIAVAPLGTAALVIGRPAMPWVPSELVRLRHLAAIAATVTAAR